MKENTLSLSVGGNSWSPLQESMNFSKALYFYYSFIMLIITLLMSYCFPFIFTLRRLLCYPITAGLQIANDYGFTDGWKILVEFLVQSMI